MQPENEPVLNFDQLSHCSRLFLILTLFYLPTFEGFRILLLSFALLLQFLFCVVFLNKKMKVWTISLSFPILKVLQLLLKSRSSIVWHFWKRNIALNQSEMKRYNNLCQKWRFSPNFLVEWWKRLCRGKSIKSSRRSYTKS